MHVTLGAPGLQRLRNRKRCRTNSQTIAEHTGNFFIVVKPAVWVWSLCKFYILQPVM